MCSISLNSQNNKDLPRHASDEKRCSKRRVTTARDSVENLKCRLVKPKRAQRPKPPRPEIPSVDFIGAFIPCESILKAEAILVPYDDRRRDFENLEIEE